MDTSVEVILCTYNGAGFIVEQLESIVSQTRPVEKVSIYDDCSTDDTVQTVSRFVAQLPVSQRHKFSIKVNERTLGYAQNFCKGIALASADVLFLCDQDDVWEPRKVHILLDLLEQRNVDMVFSDGWLLDESGRRLATKTVLQLYGLAEPAIVDFSERTFELLLRRNYIAGAACAVRRNAAQTAMPLPCDMPHDYWLAIWCALHEGIAASPLPLYGYRQHRNNAIGLQGWQNNLLYEWLGLWRQPTTPRQRELRIWKAISSRISTLPNTAEIDSARRKVNWLSLVTDRALTRARRASHIIKSAWNGSYKRYSPDDAFWRDVVSLIK